MTEAEPALRPLRTDLVIGPHPDLPEQTLIYCPRTGRRFVLPTEGMGVAGRFDGRRTAAQVVDSLRSDGPMATEDVVRALAADLARLGLLVATEAGLRPPPAAPPGQWVPEMLPEDLPIETHPQARFRCIEAGTCCRSGYLIPVDAQGAERLRRAARRSRIQEDPVVLLPTRPGQRWTHALHNDPDCPFLGSDRRCQLHGRAAHPSACQTFPLAFTRVGARVHVTVTHRCVCGVFGDGVPLARRRRHLQKRARLGPVPRIYPYAALDRTRRIDLEGADRLVQASLQETSGPQMLRAAWAAVTPEASRSDSGPDPVATRSQLAEGIDLEDDPILQAALLGSGHPLWTDIEADLKRVQAHDPDADRDAEVARFVRDHLYGLRVYQHETVIRGLFALTLAAVDLAASPGDHPQVRGRIMMWEDAFASPSFRGLMGSHGPLADRLDDATRAWGWVRTWL